MPDNPRIGFIGLGNMGGKMAKRLAAARYPLSVFDISPASARAVAGQVDTAASAADAAAGADIVCTSLPGPAAVSAVYDEILRAMKPGSVAVDLSTIDPDTAVRIADACARRGVAFLDAPVSRGVQAAESGTLSIMVGGDAETLERVRLVLDHLATSIIHCGRNGTGQMVKLCNNMVAAITMATLGEVLVSGVRKGLDTELLYQVLQSSSAASHILSEYFPRVVFTPSRPTGFSLDFMVKDVDLYLNAVTGSGVPSILAPAVREIFATCQEQGLGPRDATAVVEFYEGPVGVRLETEGIPA